MARFRVKVKGYGGKIAARKEQVSPHASLKLSGTYELIVDYLLQLASCPPGSMPPDLSALLRPSSRAER